jgi:mono/diheme cytochrome c family protein
MNNLIDQIDAYLDGTMNATDRAAFETKMNADASLREQVNTQQNLRAGIDRIGMKAATAQTFRKITLKNKFYKWGVATVAVAAIATSAYLINNSVSSTSDGPEITYELPATNEEGGTEWADADRNLPTQLFTINPTKDTVIETMGGIVFAIPAGAFVNAKDPMTLEIREALTPMDIMKGGLSTTSNGELLETGGMFYINARNGETSLQINPDKPVYANVPTNEIRPGMQLFEGERTVDGGVNWVNPKPMEKQLIPVDIFSLNFYPDGFLEKVTELGFDANDRRVTDSIYYSYAGRQQTGITTSSDSAKVRHILIGYKGAASSGPEITRTKEQAKAKADDLKRRIQSGENMANLVESNTDDPGSKSGNKGDYGWFTHESGFVEPFKNAGFNNNVGDVVVVETDFGYHVIQVLDKTSPTTKVEYGSRIDGPDGQALFKGNCASCHTATDTPSTGPGLKGVLERIPGGNWRYDWIHNADQLVASGDPYAITIQQNYKGAQTHFPQLTNEEIDAVLAYTDHGGKPYGLEIDPARIAAIVSSEFQNTIIATKEFEERLQVIFKKGNPAILDLYVNNLDKKLYRTDSMAMNMIEGNEFREFYARHDGGVAIEQSHMKELQEYYKKKQEAVRIASEKTYNTRTAEQRKQDSIYLRSTTEHEINSAKQSGENFTKEYDTNLKEAYRQLGIDPNAKPPAPDYYGVEVTTTGWCNVDAYVYQSTATRTTLDYTDTTTGKKAIIKYEELKVNIPDATGYSQLMVYLIADKLPCFQKVNNSTGEYKENLDELFEYSLVVIGEKDGTWFSAITPKVTPGVVNVTMLSTDENALRNTLNSTFTGKVGSDFSAEVSYIKETRQYNVRKEKEKQQQSIDDQIMRVIFPFLFYGAK